MKSFKEKWFQEVAELAKLPPVSPEVVSTLSPVIELHLRKLIQNAHKLQRRSKSRVLKVEDVNQALINNKLEPVYGLHLLTDRNELIDSDQGINNQGIISINDFATASLPPCPLKPSINLHWLAVNGVQPSIAENPTVVESDAEQQPTSLPKELQLLYARITGVILNTNNDKVHEVVFKVLRTDAAMQELLPNLSHFFYVQVKTNSKRLSLLRSVMKSICALHQNPRVNLESHLQQLLPAIFTCVVASKLSMVYFEDHWSLRLFSARLIADLANRYSTCFPDLHARVCKTFIEALQHKSSLTTVYGGIMGIGSLGYAVVKSLFLKYLPQVHEAITAKMDEIESLKSALREYEQNQLDLTLEDTGSKKRKADSQLVKQQEYLKECISSVEHCREAVKLVLGNYMSTSMQLPSLPWKQQDSSENRGRAMDECCGLEEELVAYYVASSNDLPFNKMVI